MQTRLIRKLRKLFPHTKNPQNLVDVIDTAITMNAIDLPSGKNRGLFEQYGVTPYAIKLASEKEILDKNNPPRFYFVRSERGFIVKREDQEMQLRKELRNFYNHLTVSEPVQIVCRELLHLSQVATTNQIISKIESLDVNKRITVYDRIVKRLQKEKLYAKKYDYAGLGFRTKAARYWLSKLGRQLAKLLDKKMDNE